MSQDSPGDLPYRWRNYFSYLDRQYFEETYSQVIPAFPEGLIWHINNDPTSASSTISNGDFSQINDTLSELDYEADDSLTEGRSLLYESRQPPSPESLFPTSDEDNSDEEQPDWSDWEDVNPTTPADLFEELRIKAHEQWLFRDMLLDLNNNGFYTMDYGLSYDNHIYMMWYFVVYN